MFNKEIFNKTYSLIILITYLLKKMACPSMTVASQKHKKSCQVLNKTHELYKT